MNKYENIFEFYKITNKLKYLVRSGWKIWGVKSDRLESDAEHVFGTQMLALAVINELNLDLNLEHVMFLLAIHELGEAIIGDITPHDNVSKEEKKVIEQKAVKDIFTKLKDGEKYYNIFLEFDNRLTKEGKFAHIIDKLEADLQVKYYEDKQQVSLTSKKSNEHLTNLISEYQKRGFTSVAEMWFDCDSKLYDDEIMKAIEEKTIDN